MQLKINDIAPNFSIIDTDRKIVNLSDFIGKKIILAFYPGAFTGVCEKELCTFRDSLQNFSSLNAQVIGISVDSPFANKAFALKNNLTFSLLSDYTREVSKQYGGVHEDFAQMKGYSVSKRSVFVIDESGTIKYIWVTENPGVEPNYDEIKSYL